METGLRNTRTYYVPLITDDRGRTLAVHLHHSPATGKVLWLFTSERGALESLSEYMSRTGEREKAVRQIIEQRGPGAASTGLHVGEHVSAKTLPEIKPDLERWKVERLIVDPEFSDAEPRVYELPLD
jgi:hypothetical protein